MFSKSKTRANRFNEACLIGVIWKYSGNYIGVYIAFLNDA
ncbi:putative membrane protein [Burkholderia cepacia]|nr:putative membrane protein [Burkholderia cepacia]